MTKLNDHNGQLPSKILEGQSPPPGLSPYMISSWLSGHSKTAIKDHIDWVLDRLKKQHS